MGFTHSSMHQQIDFVAWEPGNEARQIHHNTFSLEDFPNPVPLESAAAKERGSNRAAERGSLVGGRERGSPEERGSVARGSVARGPSGSFGFLASFPALDCFKVAGSSI